jgi:predicted HAD superfamily Cof-like phosphohydrolase
MSDRKTPYSPLHATMAWFQLARPNPDDENVHTQMGVHFEEVAEMLEQLKGKNDDIEEVISTAYEAMKALSLALKGSKDLVEVKDRNEMLDALCDQIVTGVGVAHMLDFGIIGAMEEVNHSNYSKFVDGSPLFDENGKVKKGPHYVKANLSAFI